MKCATLRVRSFACVLACVIFSSLNFLHAQNKITVTGKVTDANGEVVPGATVEVKGTSQRVTTTPDGLFTLPNLSGSETLMISYVGYETMEVAVNNRSLVNVSLTLSQKTLDDVVVIGYGTQKRRNVTSAVTNYDAKNLDQRPVLRVDQALVGQMAGVTVKQTTGSLGKGFSIQVRGSGSITAGNEPL